MSASPATAAADDGKLRILLFYKENFHASQAQARVAVKELAASIASEYGQTLEIQETDNPVVFTPENLATTDGMVFVQTGGVLFNGAQRTALENYIRGGGGFAGIHYTGWSVGTSEHDENPFYLRLVGAMSEGHPENPGVRPGTVKVSATGHPLTAGIDASFSRSDEWYDWTLNPAPNVKTLLEADEMSYGSLGRQGTKHPITWCQTIDSGRSWYTGMGHEGTAYSEPVMRQQIRHGIAYATGLLAADCSPPKKDVAGAWSGVKPWPLMPINMALTSDGKVQSFGSVGTATCNDNALYDFTGNSCVVQGGQTEIDVWDPNGPARTVENLRTGIVQNATYTDLFCSMQVQNPHTGATMTVGGDDGLGGNDPNDAAIGVTSYTTNQGLRNEAPMNYPRWYPTGTTMPDGSIVVQGGSSRGGPGGPGVLTPEIYTPDSGNGWKALTGATSGAAYGDGGADHAGDDENRWWYPRAFVAPGSGKLFNISGTQMFELDPSGNGTLTLRGTLPTAAANQGGTLGRPVGATSTATMYRPGKILQVGGGAWSNGGGGAGARGAFTVDITGGTANPVVQATDPMQYQRHWATSTVLPDGDVLVTGGSRDNNGDGGYVTNPEIWDPETGDWTTIEVPAERARLYHSSALLLPDGRVMVGGGGAPGPRNYTDVEYYSPSYLFDGDSPAARPTLSSVPDKVGYGGTFQAQATGTVSRVTLVRNGSVTHGFNNDQNFQDLQFTQNGGALTITAPQDGTYAPPGAYMLFVFNAAGTPSVAKILDIDPAVKQDQRTPQVVDQFEYPRLPADWRGGNPAQVVDVAAGAPRMNPWSVKSDVQLVRGIAASQGGLGAQGYHLGLGQSGHLERRLTGLDVGREYRVSLRYARDSRVAGTGSATAQLAVAGLDATLTATTANPSQGKAGTFATYVGTFTATKRSEVLTLKAPGSGAAMMIDDLVVISQDPGTADVPIRYQFEEGTGQTVANTGTDSGVGPAVLTGTAGYANDGVFGKALSMTGGSNVNAVDLPDNLLRNETDFTTSFWVRPSAKQNWIGMFHIGDDLGDNGSFFQIQMQTQAAGNTGLAATFKKKGSTLQERVYATPTKDVVANRWNHVAFTRTGTTGTLYLDGVQVAQRTNLTLTMADIGATANNWLGRNGYPDPAYNGAMDEVRLYRSALAASDIAALYEDGAALRTTTTVTASPASPSPANEPVVFTGTVQGENSQPAVGSAELWVDGAQVGAGVPLAQGVATFPGHVMGRGNHQVEVRYLPDTGYRASTGTLTHEVLRPPPGSGVPIRYPLNEGTGTTTANVGTSTTVGAAQLQGSSAWTTQGKFGRGVNLPGGASTTNSHIRLPDNIQEGMDEEFSISIWTNPRALPNWVPLVQIGSSTDTFFLLQSSTQAGPNGSGSGFAATFKKAGNGNQERLTLGAGNDVPLNQWTHVVYTHSGTTGKIYFNGELKATRNNFTFDMSDVGVNGTTTANWIGGTSWPDPRWNGVVDEFQMYDYELTPEQIATIGNGPVNTAPTGVADTFTTGEDTPLTVPAPGVLGNDTDDEGNTLTATNATQPAHGSVTLAANGSFTYTPDLGFHGTDTFTYTAYDGTTASAVTTVTLTVTKAPNTAPEASDDAYTTDQGDPLTVAAPGVLANDSDADDDELTATNLTQPDHGTVELAANGSFTYTPDATFFGTDAFTYTAHDGEDDSEPATVTITVEKGPEATTVSGTTASVVYGRAGSVQVRVAPATAGGRVELVHGSKVLGAGTLASGRATIALPAKSLVPGSYRLSVRYVGDAGHRASTGAVQVRVAKATPTLKVTAPKSVKRGARPTVKVTLSATGGVPLSGTVTAKVGGKTVKGTVRGGKVTLRLAKATKAGTLKVTVTYAGSSLANKAVKTVKIKVKR
ncbi:MULTISPECIES: LamG-like jellyroll fold domain-containing protein [unclassified Nocardioides]|uniref:LamG-like jellyroll fold domain-containing protein n=1 Tax=unclassified Nocardioides TaxID=2615069 RepID=UPI00301493AF